MSALLEMSEGRCRNVLRHYLRRQGLPLPDHRHLQQIIDTVLMASWDAEPCVHWPGAEVRRYRNRLYAMPPLTAHDVRQVIPWDLRQPLELPGLGKRLVCRPGIGQGIKQSLCAGREVTVRFRQGGERCRLPGRTESHRLKHLLQEQGVPPWRRERIPLIYVGGDLAQVAGYWTCEPFLAGREDAGLAVSIEPA
ncbi:MAG: hypothetical protein A2V90_07660 [Gammaproteobacteria bacterium RBG_16_57_12]|nr:MAG: hypothetical protein A2V90_07660 [Gammaproteobacteria bacterium RBG_16_57_12]